MRRASGRISSGRCVKGVAHSSGKYSASELTLGGAVETRTGSRAWQRSHKRSAARATKRSGSPKVQSSIWGQRHGLARSRA
eukprot:6531376-Lingulodinium_polyedra.AAC.1